MSLRSVSCLPARKREGEIIATKLARMSEGEAFEVLHANATDRHFGTHRGTLLSVNRCSAKVRWHNGTEIRISPALDVNHIELVETDSDSEIETTTKEKEMNVSRKQVNALLKELGMVTCDKWTDAKCLAKLHKLPEYSDDKLSVETDASLDLLNKVLEALEKEQDVVIAGAKKKAAAKKPAASTKKKPAASTKKKPATEKAAKKRTAVEKDDFGTRVGTQAAEITKAIPTKGISLADLQEKSGAKASSVRAHINALRQRGHVTLDEGIVKRTKPSASAKKKAPAKKKAAAKPKAAATRRKAKAAK